MNDDEYEEDGIVHELLAPGNFRETGPILDDELYSSFVSQIPKGVHATVIIDTCHPVSFRSGKSCAIDLPYVCSAGDEELRYSEGFRPGRMAGGGAGAGIAAGAVAAISKSKKKKKDKKKKPREGGEDEKVESMDVSGDETKSKKKSKKKKNKQENEENSGGGGSEEKSKKKKKKKKSKE